MTAGEVQLAYREAVGIFGFGQVAVEMHYSAGKGYWLSVDGREWQPNQASEEELAEWDEWDMEQA